MFTTPTPDFGSGMAILIFGTWALIGWALPAVFIEALVLHLLLAIEKWRALLESFVANAITTIAGLITVATLGPGLYEPLTKLSGQDYYYNAGEHHIQYIIRIAIITCIVSTLIEGMVVWGFEKRIIPESQIWGVSVIANVLSYIIGIGAIVVWLGSKI